MRAFMTAETLAEASGGSERPDLVVGDLSFISLGLVLPALVATVAPGADFVLLIKPQFEVGRTGIREGIVHDTGAARRRHHRGAVGGLGPGARYRGTRSVANRRRCGQSRVSWSG